MKTKEKHTSSANSFFINYNNVDDKTREGMDRLFKAPRKNFWIKKRLFDIVFSCLALLILLPFFVIIGIIIFIDDPHASPIFCQKRVGRHGKIFTIYKFRSMVANAEKMRNHLEEKNEMDGPVFKIKDDPRITRVGKIIRKMSIDELPQLINVLKGDMSFVGPRPPLPSEVAQYDDYQNLRLVVTPGLTCIWQTTSGRNDVPFETWVEMDIEYIQNRTMIMDLKIIAKTVLVMITKEGQ